MALEYAATPAALESLTTLGKEAREPWLREDARLAAERLERRLRAGKK